MILSSLETKRRGLTHRHIKAHAQIGDAQGGSAHDWVESNLQDYVGQVKALESIDILPCACIMLI